MNYHAAAIISALLFAISFQQAPMAAQCDRECLKEIMSDYIEAMENHSVDALPLADDVKATEDCEVIQAGEGYFSEYDGSIDYRLDIVDVRTGGIFSFLVVMNTGSEHLYGVRLKLADAKIVQIETMIVKNSTEGMLYEPDNFKSYKDTTMGLLVDSSLRNTREEMIDMTVKYPDALKKGGTFQDNGMLFVDGAYRLENGMQMAGPGCTMIPGCENISTQGLPTLGAMVYQPALVDEETGIVLIRMNFGKGSVMGDDLTTLDVFESFKMYGDSVHAVRAFMQTMPDSDDRSPENLFKWNYEEDVTGAYDVPSRRNSSVNKVISVTRSGIAFSAPLSADNAMLEYFSLSGRRVFSQFFPVKSTASLYVAHPSLSAGVYPGRMTITSGTGSVAVQRFTVTIP